MKKLFWLLFIFSTNSFACSCVIPSHPTKRDYLYNLAHSDAVFTGTVTSLSPTDPSIPYYDQQQRVTIRVDQVFKGILTTEQVVTTGGICGMSSFTPGKSFLVYAVTDKNGNLHVSGCSYTKEFKAKSRELKVLRKASNYAIKGTAVKIQHSSDSSAAAVPYFGC
jgi:hypothetical protein